MCLTLNKTGNMDKNERETLNARGGKKTGSSSFGGGFSINKFLNSLGAVPEMTERQQDNAFKPQRDDIDLADDVNELDTNVAEKSAPEYVGDENTNARKETNSDDAFDERERAVINKFSGVRWIRKNKNTTPSDGVAAQNAADINKSAVPEKAQGQVEDISRKKEPEPETALTETNIYTETAQHEINTQAEASQKESTAQTGVAQTEATQNAAIVKTDTVNAAGAQDDEFDDFDAFLKSLESEEAAVEARQTNQPNSSASGAANGVATAAGDADGIVTGSAGNAVSSSQNVSESAGKDAAIESAESNASEMAAGGKAGKAEATGTQNTDAAGTDGGKRRKSISKLDYFKYRFLDNSATGANGKANLERMTSRFGTRRQETASTITSAHGEVNVSAKDDLYGKEINLDFSKKGNAKVYHNTQTLAFVACIAAFIYAIAGVVVFMMFGIVTPPKIEVVSAKLNVGGIIYAQKGETLDLSNVKIFVNYNNGQKKTVAFDKSLIVEKDAAMIDDDLKVVGLSQTEPTVIKVAYDNKVGEILVWGYEWTVGDVQLSYFLTKGDNLLGDFSNVCCVAKFSKTVGAGTSYAKTITKTSTIVDFENDVTSASLSGSNIRFEGNVGGIGGSWTAEKVG